ncbi:MAG: hypothetical protein V9H69_23885 [Anaerolineae bacterium]
MGWLDVINVGLNLGNAAISAGNAAKLEEMRRQGATTEAMLAITAILRDQIFRYKQTAEAILSSEGKSPKIAAASMKFLELNLDRSSIRPDLFLELSDKEYCAKTTRLIHENSVRMFGQLSPTEQLEIGRVVEAADRKPDYEYYLANYANYQAYNAVKPTYNSLASKNSCGAKMMYLVWVAVGLAIMFTSLMISLVASVTDSGFLSFICGISGLVTAIGGVGVMAWGFVRTSRQQKASEFNAAKRVVEDVTARVDVSRMQALDAEFGDKSQAEDLLRQAQATLNHFLQGAQLLPA